MSQFYYDWFLMCYTNEPPTVTIEQLIQAEQMGLITTEEHQAILAAREPVEELATVDEPPTYEI